MTKHKIDDSNNNKSEDSLNNIKAIKSQMRDVNKKKTKNLITVPLQR